MMALDVRRTSLRAKLTRKTKLRILEKLEKKYIGRLKKKIEEEEEGERRGTGRLAEDEGESGLEVAGDGGRPDREMGRNGY
jgi:hypothetical protein